MPQLESRAVAVAVPYLSGPMAVPCPIQLLPPDMDVRRSPRSASTEPCTGFSRRQHTSRDAWWLCLPIAASSTGSPQAGAVLAEAALAASLLGPLQTEKLHRCAAYRRGKPCKPPPCAVMCCAARLLALRALPPPCVKELTVTQSESPWMPAISSWSVMP